ncbi:MAG: ferredoxin [Labrys sp. (in: a-proteobacteria)]|jgi:hypothetical protein
MGVPTLDRIGQRVAAAGLTPRGAFHPITDDGVPSDPDGRAGETLLLLGFVGDSGWPAFSRSPEHGDGAAHPLDRWSRRVIDGLAAELGGWSLFPFSGPPYHPFQRWAMRAEPVHPSPLGLLIHPEYGLWHSYRGAIAFPTRLALPPRSQTASPCLSCVDKPCLTACPVSAFSLAGYDVAACGAHLQTTSGEDCMTGGCLARRACPVGAGHRPRPAQTAFTMAAFRAARG